jgi:hypothetical protein
LTKNFYEQINVIKWLSENVELMDTHFEGGVEAAFVDVFKEASSMIFRRCLCRAQLNVLGVINA